MTCPNPRGFLGEGAGSGGKWYDGGVCGGGVCPHARQEAQMNQIGERLGINGKERRWVPPTQTMSKGVVSSPEVTHTPAHSHYRTDHVQHAPQLQQY